MAKPNLTIDAKGDFLTFRKFLNARRLKRNLDREIRRGTIKNALFLIKQVKVNIRSKPFESNAPLTLALKRSNMPLMDEKNLWDAINYTLKDAFSAEVGIVGTARISTGSKGKGRRSSIMVEKLVELMEEGFTITVTQEMRSALMASLREQVNPKTGNLTGKAKRGLKGAAKVNPQATYRVPPRPLLSSVWKNRKIRRELRKNWRQALERVWKNQGAKGGEHREKR